VQYGISQHFRLPIFLTRFRLRVSCDGDGNPIRGPWRFLLDGWIYELLDYLIEAYMELVAVKTKFQVVIPQSIRKRVRLDVGDLLEASFENGKIILTPKTVIDRHLAEGLVDLARGRTHGPYKSAAAAISALEHRAKGRKKNAGKRK
jgi:AbrB family looped-hinge helix DNA binding protein